MASEVPLDPHRLDRLANCLQMSHTQKIFIVRKYVKACSVAEAIRKERHIEPDDCFVDEEWRKANLDTSEGKVMGFQVARKTKKRGNA
jgi:hypothetical protein